MQTLSNSFVYAGGPGVIICAIACFAPYYYFSDYWQAPINREPIILGLQSLSYQYSLVAVLAASIPPLIEVIADIIITRGKSNMRPLIIFAVLFCLFFPELVALKYISPNSDAKMYLCGRSSVLSIYCFLGCMFLCQYSPSFWKTKWCSFAVITISIGNILVTFPPYFKDDIKLWIQYLGAFVQLTGSATFLVLSYKFLTTKLPDDSNSGQVIADDLLCRYATLFITIVILALFPLYFSTGLKYWTNYNGIFLAVDNVILSSPSIGMCVALSHAIRNEAYFMQNVRQKFVRYISHEMRTPLNTAVMGLQYLHNELMKSSRETELLGVVEEVKGACEISVIILNEILDFDKLQSGLMKLEKEEVNVKRFLETTLSPFDAQAIQKDIRLQYDLHNNLSLDSLVMEIDSNKFAQVIRNLLSNALKFTPKGGSVRIVTNVIEVDNRRQAITNLATTLGGGSNTIKLLRIDVIDSGVGVSKENQQILFKEIVQFNPGKLQGGGGSGLGLYISKGIMDLHQGDLLIASEGEGFGCTFTVTIQVKYQKGGVVGVGDSVTHSEFGECKERNRKDPVTTTSSSSIMRNISNSALTRLRTTGSYAKISPRRSVPDSTKYQKQLDECRSFSQYEEPPSSSSSSSPDHFPLPHPPMYKVLVVDDSTSNRKMLIRLLKDSCSDITEAVDGLDAIKKIKQLMEEIEEKDNNIITTTTASTTTTTALAESRYRESTLYDAVLMDFIMPNMEGPEAARGMRELGYTGLIIGITGNALPVDKERFRSHGANIVLTKPINAIDINNALKSMVSSKNV